MLPNEHGFDRANYSLREAMRHLGVGRTKMYSMISSGEIKTIRIGRKLYVTAVDLGAFLDKHRELANA